MLTGTDERIAGFAPVAAPSGRTATNKAARSANAAHTKGSRLAKALRVEWLGQTVASLCWIASVFVYGITSAGDWLQLGAASAWFVANLAAIATTDAE